jgi:dihydrolipoamide dehydrogenase
MVMGEFTEEAQVLVIGSGPGGYAAAFRAADLGLEVTMVDVAPKPGGECLFRGCIPSKTLLSLAELIHDVQRSERMGVSFGKPRIEPENIRKWKQEVVDKLADGLVTLSKKRGVELIQGRAEFESSDTVRLHDSEVSRIKYRHAILATGSHPSPFQGTPFEKGSRIMDSAGALELPEIPESLLIIGGGYIALEMGSVYASLGSRVSLAIRSDRMLRGADADLVAPLGKRLQELFAAIHFNTRIKSMKEKSDRVDVVFEGEIEKPEESFDRVLVAVGRDPTSKGLGLDKTNVKTDNQGFVIVDEHQRTSDEKLFAIGDVAGGLQLAHKAFREGKVAAEVIAGEPSAFDVRAIPAVVFTDPQVAWCGLTEEQARKQKRSVRVERYPWKFSPRATTIGATGGVTKMVVDPESGRVLGFGIVGRHAEGLISEGVLAVEMGALAADVGLSIHPHPTLSETVGEVAEIFLGSVTHLMPKKGKT